MGGGEADRNKKILESRFGRKQNSIWYFIRLYRDLDVTFVCN
jgi:hypothetical protein